MFLPFYFLESNNSDLRNIINAFKDNQDAILSDKIDISDKLNWLINFSIANTSNIDLISPLLLLLIIMLSYIVIWFGLICFYSLIELPTYQFILFTEYSKKMKKRYLVNSKKKILFYVCGLIISIVCSVSANYVYEFLSKI